MDSYILTGPDGRQIEVGSYIALDKGQPDFGAKDLIQAVYAENANAEGGALAYETVGVRKFVFPVRLASSAAFAQGLAGAESVLRQLARPGAYIDLIPHGVATADLVRFDVIDGRYEEDYSVVLQRHQRRDGKLTLDVQPFGYSPTWIVLASAASVGLPGALAIPAASVLGDVPGWAEIVLGATGATNYGAGTWVPDYIAWSLAGKASFSAYFPAASIASAINGTLTADIYAAGSQAVALYPSPTAAAWQTIAIATIGSALEPAYRGRFRGFAYAKLGPSQALPWMLSLDAQPAPQAGAALASWQPVASVAPAVATGTPGYYGAPASPGYQLVDLGELTLPPVGSGLAQDVLLRLWANPATSNIGVGTPILSIGGLYLQPLDGPAGILPRGLGQPSILTPSVGRLYLDGYTKRALISQPTGDVGSAPVPAAAALTHYRGGMPMVGASTVQLDVLGAARKVASGATAPIVRSAAQFASVSVRYRPRFTFLKAV